jgi:hypothetical protein
MPASSAVQAGDGPALAVTTFGSDWTPPYLEGVRPQATSRRCGTISNSIVVDAPDPGFATVAVYALNEECQLIEVSKKLVDIGSLEAP